jgi:hypothetical protein
MFGVPMNRQLPTTASTSISTSQRGSRNPWTTMKPVAGRILPKASPCTCATASPWAASTRNTRVRTTSRSVAPDSRRASSMISRHRRACTPTSGSTWPSGQIAAVAETKTRCSWRTARLKPMVGSNGEPELMCCRTPCRLRGAHRSPCCCSPLVAPLRTHSAKTMIGPAGHPPGHLVSTRPGPCCAAAVERPLPGDLSYNRVSPLHDDQRQASGDEAWRRRSNSGATPTTMATR